MRWATFVATGLFGIAAVAASAATLDTSSEQGPGASGQPGAPFESPPGLIGGAPPGRGDSDGDGIADNLQAKLAGARADALFDVIVTFSGPGKAADALAAAGPFNVIDEFSIIDGFHATMTSGQVQALASTSGVFRVEENATLFAYVDSSDMDFGSFDARLAPPDGFGVDGTGIGVCVTDSGIYGPTASNPGHEQFDAPGKISGFCDATTGGCEIFPGTGFPVNPGMESEPIDDFGHGSHVVGILAGDGVGGPNAATFQGIAPGVTIYMAKVLDSTGFGEDAGLIKAIDWCVGHNLLGGFTKINILSMSVGIGPTDGNDALSQAVNAAAINHGIIPVASAGNSGAANTAGSPSIAEKAISVASMAEWSAPFGTERRDDGGHLSGFSSRGPVTDDLGNFIRIKPDITGPGHRITSAKSNILNALFAASGAQDQAAGIEPGFDRARAKDIQARSRAPGVGIRDGRPPRGPETGHRRRRPGQRPQAAPAERYFQSELADAPAPRRERLRRHSQDRAEDLHPRQERRTAPSHRCIIVRIHPPCHRPGRLGRARR